MAKYHVNPKTGNPGICKATARCPFGGESEHFDSMNEARENYETAMSGAVVPVVRGKSSGETNKKLSSFKGIFNANKTRDLMESVSGSSYEATISKARERASYAEKAKPKGAVTNNFKIDGPGNLLKDTAPASQEVAQDALSALRARRTASSDSFSQAATAFNSGSSAPADAATAGDALDALSARRAGNNPFVAGAAKMKF